MWLLVSGTHKHNRHGHETSQPAWLTAELFSRKIQPKLAGVGTSVIRSGIGVSRWYASQIPQAYRPHPRHLADAGATGWAGGGRIKVMEILTDSL